MSIVTVPFFISHQGCRHACVFCDQRIISGSPGELPTPDEIHSRIALWRRSAGNRRLEVAFFGGTFSSLDRADQQRLLEPLAPLISDGIVTGIRISTRPDALDGEIVSWLAGQGVTTIELGVQSMDDQVLDASGRGHTARMSASAIACVKSGGLAVGAQLMPGLPGDTPEISLNSLESVIDAGADFIRLYPVVVLRGTELARLYHAGLYRPLTVAEGIGYCKTQVLVAMKRSVDVIRIGLQADQGLSPDTVLAGCWHPALGQLVRSELYLDLMIQISADMAKDQPVTVYCHPSRVSDVIGQGRSVIARLREHGLEIRRVLPDPDLFPAEVEIRNTVSHKGSFLRDLRY